LTAVCSQKSPGGDDDDEAPLEADTIMARQAQQSPQITSPSKKIPRRGSSSSYAKFEALVQSSLSSLSPNKKSSPRRKKQGGGGLGAFLSKYDDKEQRGEGGHNKGVFSSSISFTGSIGSESSKKSMASMPARLPIMFNRSTRSDTNKETVAAASSAKCYASPHKGQKQCIVKINPNAIEQDNISSSPSAHPLLCQSPHCTSRSYTTG
jgi:hypothetical protein